MVMSHIVPNNHIEWTVETLNLVQPVPTVEFGQEQWDLYLIFLSVSYFSHLFQYIVGVKVEAHDPRP